MHEVIRLSNMIELLPPPLAEGALGDTIGGVACSRDEGQLNSPPPYRGRSALGGCCLLKRWRATECNLTPLKGILIISPLAGSTLGDTIGGVACSRQGEQLNSPPPHRGRSTLGGYLPPLCISKICISNIQLLLLVVYIQDIHCLQIFSYLLTNNKRYNRLT